MYLIAGLGNPTKEYDKTRHNIGFEAIDKISEDYKISVDTCKHKAIIGKGRIEGETVILAKPLTYMNLSGESIREIVDYYKIDIENIIIIFDDISLSPGQLRIRAKGSAGGHNGIKNIIQHLGTEEFKRIKIGVGEKPQGWDLKDYVLGRFNSEEQAVMKEALENASKAAAMMISSGITDAMNMYNKKA